MTTTVRKTERGSRTMRLSAIVIDSQRATARTPRVTALAHPWLRWKAWIDYPLAAALLVLTAPLMMLAMLAVRLTSSGPVIYSQKRVGLAGKVFTIYKIRSMVVQQAPTSGTQWATKADPRVTPVGRILRKLHLDELPQLWNVLRGEMAMIGPRPERPEIVDELRQVIPSYDLRHRVKPGITGFAQVHLPADTNLQSVKNKVAYDKHYIRKMGLGMDVAVYLCTALKVFHLKSLYRRLPLKPTDDV
jgi:lipopolysaccharide/colanic/teichoic acid biosynthesis glycosyltransferase